MNASHPLPRALGVKPGYRARRLEEIEGDLERGVFMALYRSREQRRRRALAWVILYLKHGLRGLVFTWPLYAMALAAAFLPAPLALLFLLLGVPGVGVSLFILRRAVREDHARHVREALLGNGYAKWLLYA